jgi:hypothetical protein
MSQDVKHAGHGQVGNWDIGDIGISKNRCGQLGHQCHAQILPDQQQLRELCWPATAQMASQNAQP